MTGMPLTPVLLGMSVCIIRRRSGHAGSLSLLQTSVQPTQDFA